MRASTRSRTWRSVAIPAHIRFGDLRLRRESGGRLSYDTAALEAIAMSNGLTLAELSEAGAFAELLSVWYMYHRAIGGVCDPVMESLIELGDEHGAVPVEALAWLQ